MACAPHATPTLPSHFALEQAALRRRETVSLKRRFETSQVIDGTPEGPYVDFVVILIIFDKFWC